MLVYLWSFLPKAKVYSPALLMRADSLLSGAEETEMFMKAIIAAAVSAVILIAVSVFNMSKRQWNIP